MLSHIASDLHQAYLEEVFKPQLGKPGASTPAQKETSTSDIDGDGDVDSFEKKVRQFIYDVRHLMRKQNIPVERAFQIRSSKTNYGAEVIKTAKEKLGIKSGGTAPVSEESTGRMVTVTINYKNGTVDRRNVPYSEVSQLRSKPTISSVEVSSNKVSYPGAGEKYEKKYGKGGKNTVGDRDGDGTREPNSHEYAGVKDNAIKKAKSKLKGYGVSEGFSNWRQDLKEVLGVDDEIASRKEKQITEKPVDNYKNGTVVINPDVTEKSQILGGHIVESVELGEDYLNETVEIATQFFYNCGLNENGVEIVIEELGEEKFTEFVFDLAEEYFLSEARTLTGKKTSPATGKQLGISRKAAPGKTTKAEVEKHGTTRTLSSSSPSGTIKKRDIGKEITAAKVNDAVDNGKKTQAPSSEKSRPAGQERIRKTVNATIARVTSPEARKTVARTAGNLAKDAANTLSRVALSGLEGHKKAMETKGKGGSLAQQLGSGAGTALKSFFTKGTKQFKEWVESLIEEGYDLSDWTTEELYEEYGYLCEKAESEQQQKLFGLALSVKRGETPRSEASAEVLKIVDSMSEKKIRDFAKTPHSEVPKKKVNEAIANPTPEKKSPRITRTQKETSRIRVLKKLLDFARLREEMDSKTNTQQTQKPNNQSAINQVLTAKAKSDAAEKELATKQRMASQKGVNLTSLASSYDPEGDQIDEEMPKRARGQSPSGTRTFTGMGYYGRSQKEKRNPKSMKPIFPEPKEEKPLSDDENRPRRRTYSGSDVD